MAVTETIQELLQGIDDAQYGRDMRQYIHKGIQKCYEEGSAGETDLVAREAIADIQAEIADNTLSTDILNELTFATQTVVSPITGECYYYKTGATVVIHIGAQITGNSTFSSLARLPEGYRPHKRIEYLVPHSSDGFSKISIQTNGYISITVVGSGTSSDYFEMRFEVFEEST